MNKPRLLVIGLGSIGERHLRCALASGLFDPIGCETNSVLCKTIVERYRDVTLFENIEHAMTKQPMAAAICVPAHLHVPIAQKLTSAGIHTLIEKPLSTTSAGVSELQATVAQRKLISAVAYVYRAYPQLAAVRSAICSGHFGHPLQVVAVAGQNFPTYRPAYRDTYYADRATGGGAIQDALTHLINAAEWLVGPIDRVVADAAHQAIPGVSVEDTVHVIARHGDVMASYALNQHQAPNETTLTIACEKGTLRCDFDEPRWQWMTSPESEWHDEQVAPQERDTPFATQLHAFYTSITSGAAPLCSLAEGIQTFQVNMALIKSVETGAWVDVQRLA